MALEPFRQAFSQTTRQGIFFDNASMGPVIPAVTQAMARCMELRQAMPMKYYRYAEELFPACRGRIAALMGAQASEIAFTENVAYGINCAAGAIPFQPGDNVILCDREFASNVYPWMLLERTRGVRVRMVPSGLPENLTASGLSGSSVIAGNPDAACGSGGLTLELLEQYADERTRAVAVSSVEFSDGYAADLEAIGRWCHERNIYFVVDGAQSLGVRPMDVKKYHIDSLAGLSSKWLLGPFSTGFLYVRKELISQLVPPFAGADSVRGDVDALDYALDFKEDASRFETGLPNAPGIAGLNASLAFMEEIGFEAIYKEAWKVSAALIRVLKELHFPLAPCALSDACRSTIVSFQAGPHIPAGQTATEATQKLYRYLREQNIACSFRCGYIRMGIHGYNSEEEVFKAAEILKKYRPSV